MSKVKIVCTLGPACSDHETMTAMVRAGMNVARFNFSHGNYEGHLAMLELVRTIEKEQGIPIATLLDTKGPEIRTGKVEGGLVRLEQGQLIALTTDKSVVLGTAARVFVNYEALPREVTPGQEIFIDDGTLQLAVESVSASDVLCRVIVGGLLADTKGVNIPGAEISSRPSPKRMCRIFSGGSTIPWTISPSPS